MVAGEACRREGEGEVASNYRAREEVEEEEEHEGPYAESERFNSGESEESLCARVSASRGGRAKHEGVGE